MSKVKQSSMILFLSMMVIVINCRWGEFIPFIPSVGNIYDVLLIVLLFFWCQSVPAVRRECMGSKFLNRMILTMLLLWVMELFYTWITNGNTFMGAFTDFAQWHLKILFVYPMVYLMKRFGINKILRYIVAVQIVFVVIQSGVAVVYNLTHTMLVAGMFKSDAWVRSGLIRMSSSPLTCFAALYFFSMFLNERRMIRRVRYLLYTFLLFLFFVFVNAGRSQYFAVVAALVMMYMIYRKSSVKQIGAVITLLVIGYAVINSSFFANIVTGLIEDYNDGTISYRLELMEWFSNEYGFFSILGLGYIGTSIRVGTMSFNFIDYGLLGDYLQFGFVSVLYFTLLVARGFSVQKDIINPQYRILVIGISCFLLASAVGFTPLTGKRVILIPIVLACYECMQDRHRERTGGEIRINEA